MQLRHHPLIYSGSAWNWPPVWTELTKDGKILRGEIGILKKSYPERSIRRQMLFSYRA